MAAITENRIREIIALHLGVRAERICGDTHLADDLGADSLDQIELVMAFEDEMQTEIPDDDAMKVHTFSDAVALLTSLSS